jgi:chromosome segregation ATPase
MGRKALHTREEVFAAADQLAAEGRDVTASALLASLGGGSLTTIYKHLEAWETSRKDTPRPVVIEMPEAVSAAFARAWQAAAQEAGKEIAAIREKTDAEIRAIGKRFEEALTNIERLEAEANEDAARLESLAAQLADRDTALREAATREAALKATVEQMGRQIDAQQAELERVHAEAEAERQERKAEIDRLTGELDRERRAGETARQETSAAREEAARWRGQAEALQGQQGEWTRVLAAATAEPKAEGTPANKSKTTRKPAPET